MKPTLEAHICDWCSKLAVDPVPRTVDDEELLLCEDCDAEILNRVTITDQKDPNPNIRYIVRTVLAGTRSQVTVLSDGKELQSTVNKAIELHGRRTVHIGAFSTHDYSTVASAFQKENMLHPELIAQWLDENSSECKRDEALEALKRFNVGLKHMESRGMPLDALDEDPTDIMARWE